MIMWLTIIAGSVCALLALQQLRMTFIYIKVLRSPVIGEPARLQPALIHVALLDAVRYAGFAAAFFIVRWPVVVTYLLAVLFAKSVLEFLLATFRVGRFGSIQLTAKGRAYTSALELVPCTFYVIAVGISGYFLGWKAP